MGRMVDGTTELYRRKMYLLRTYGNGFSCRCVFCPTMLTYETVTSDRIIPGRDGGTYRRSNIRPACQPCNNRDGGEMIPHGKRLPLLLPYDMPPMFTVDKPSTIGVTPGLSGSPGRFVRKSHHGVAPKHRSRGRKAHGSNPVEVRGRVELSRAVESYTGSRASQLTERIIRDSDSSSVTGYDPHIPTSVDAETEQRLDDLRRKYMNPSDHI